MHVIIIGSGIAGITFAEKFKSLSPDDHVTLLTRETDGYYSRPMLSRGFTRENIEQSIILKPYSKLLENNICVISGVTVSRIDRENKQVRVNGTDGVDILDYDKLVIATGSDALIPPPFLPDRDSFFLLNSLVDLKHLRKFRQFFLDQNRNPHWAVIGGGLIGCEVASDLAVAGDRVTLYHMMDRLMERQLVADDSATLLEVMKSASIDVRLEQLVQGFKKQNGQYIVKTASGQDETYNGIIVSCGFKPRTDLAVEAGLETARGIKVNQYLKTNDAHIYALGDVAELPNQKLYAFIIPIRKQSLWLANFLAGQEKDPWAAPEFDAKAKVHGFEAASPYIF